VDEEEYQKNWRIEQSALIVFSLFLSPHLLTYDLSMLLIPIAYLFSAKMGIGADQERWLGGVLYFSATITFVYFLLGFSLVPAVMLWTMFAISQFAKRAPVGDQPGVPVIPQSC
jgi:hypothetical protein